MGGGGICTWWSRITRILIVCRELLGMYKNIADVFRMHWHSAAVCDVDMNVLIFILVKGALTL